MRIHVITSATSFALTAALAACGGTDVSDPAAQAVAVVTRSLEPATVGSPYTSSLSASGGTGTYTWSISAGGLVTGMSLSARGVLSGTPTVAGTSNFTVQVTSGAQTATQPLALVALLADPMPVAIYIDAPSSSMLVNGTVQFTAFGVDQYGYGLTAPITWSTSNSSVATASSSGAVTGIASGAAVVIASATAAGVTLTRSVPISVMPQWNGPAPPANVLVNDASRGTVPDIHQKEPSIAVFGSRIVLAWNDGTLYRDGQTIRGIRGSLGYGFSTDGGATFTDVGEVGTSRWGADPSVGVDRDGNFYISRFDLGVPTSRSPIVVFKSTDGGATFPQSATASSASLLVNDGPLMTVDNTTSPFSGNVYASWNNSGVTGWFSYGSSGADGMSFAPSIQLPIWGGPAVGPGGEVYVAGGDANLGTIAGGLFVVKSVDGGRSFGPAVRLASVDPPGEIESATAQYCGRVLRGSLRAGNPPGIAVDRSGGPNDGTVYVAFATHGTGADGADVYLTRSQDGGATWTAPSRLNDDATTNDQWLPFVAVAPDGTVAVSWYDRRLDPANMQIDLFMRISTDGGASFGPNLKITDVSFPPPAINTNLGFPPYTCYFSSYNWIAADASHFYVTWTDNRRVRWGAVDSNIYFAKVPY